VFGLDSKDAVLAAARDGSLATELRRVNVRGILREENGVLKKYVAAIVLTPHTTTISARGMRATLGLADITGDVVQAAPAARLIDCPIQGFAVEADSHQGSISTHRVLLLVKGTQQSTLEPLVPDCQSLTAGSFRVASPKARCLLSETEEFIDLHGYCNFQTMLQYRLDTDCALVLASALTIGPDQSRTITVEFMQKVTENDIGPLSAALAIEWKTALTSIAANALDTYVSPQKPEYWNEPTRKVRRLESEAKSP
jgi:hypothetical protein